MSLCACGCGNEIVIKSHHSWSGTPKYIHGHNSRGETHPMKGKHHTDYSKKQISDAKQGTIPCNKGTVGLQEAWNKGKHTPDDVKLKQSNARLGKIPWNKGLTGVQVAWNKGLKSKVPAWNKGIPPLGETRDKIAAALRGRSNPAQSERMKLMVGENSPNWQGGISFEPYCDKFNKQLKEQIRTRDSRVCQLCSTTEDDTGKKLDIHHIHYDKENCDPDLISLCRSCNMKVNANRNLWEEYFMGLLENRGLVEMPHEQESFWHFHEVMI